MNASWITVGAAVLAVAGWASGCGGETATSATGGTASNGAVASVTSSGSGGHGPSTSAAAGGSGGSETSGGGGEESGWRSVLYPKDWTPGYATSDGHRLPDFSYAGYKNGEAPIGAPLVSTVFDVTSHGADASGATDATAAIQKAIDEASKAGGVVHFPAGLYRVDGILRVKASNVVLRGEGPEQSRIAFTKSSGMGYSSHLGFQGARAFGAEEPLVSDGEPFSFEVEVSDASGFSPGDDVAIGWVISDEFIAEHAMNGYWDHASNPFGGKWQAFFRRQVVAVDSDATPNRITVDVPLRYPAKIRDQASIRRETGFLSECGLEKLGLGNAADWNAAWAQNQVNLVSFAGTKDCWVREIRSFDPPTGPTSGSGAESHLQSNGLLISESKRLTVADSELHRAENRGGSGNGYLFEVRQSSEILFRDLVATHGRHNFIQNWGFGTSGCVWLRVHSAEGNAWINQSFPGLTGYSELHHSLALANLVDQSRFDDGWSTVNREAYSSYSGHSGTQNVMWNTRGSGVLRSRQFGHGYVVGSEQIDVQVSLSGFAPGGANTAPEDFTEGLGQAATLTPQSLYDDQLAHRLAP